VRKLEMFSTLVSTTIATDDKAMTINSLVNNEGPLAKTSFIIKTRQA